MCRHQLLNSTFHHGIGTLHHRFRRQRGQGMLHGHQPGMQASVGAGAHRR
jgi:hypothetical protein